MELLDILDENGSKIGTESRKIIHSKGHIHPTIHVWIYNSKGELLLQKRSKDKPTFPGLWDLSAGGHVSAGQTYEEAVLREIWEELGLKISLDDLEFFKNKRFEGSIPEEDWYDNEFNNIYFLKYDGDIKDLKFIDGEVEDVKFFQLDELEAELADPVKQKQFCPYGDFSYYQEIIDHLREKLRL